jgi:hypothetical protein
MNGPVANHSRTPWIAECFARKSACEPIDDGAAAKEVLQPLSHETQIHMVIDELQR